MGIGNGRRRVHLAVAGAALGFVALAVPAAGRADAAGPQATEVQIVNDLYLGGAIDAELKALAPIGARAGQVVALAANLDKNADMGFATVPAGKVRLEIRAPGLGRARIVRQTKRLEVGHSYCFFVHGFGGKVWLTAADVTRQRQAGEDGETLCRDLLQSVYVPID